MMDYCDLYFGWLIDVIFSLSLHGCLVNDFNSLGDLKYHLVYKLSRMF